jgi:hypothetical protein
MTEQRREILDMLAEGKISAAEADQLLAALDREQTDTLSSELKPKAKPKYLRVVVDTTEDSDGPVRVNVRVPLQLLRAGVQIASLIPPQALGQANTELRKNGIPIDLTQLKAEQLEALVEHLNDLTVEVDQPDTHVRVFCE